MSLLTSCVALNDKEEMRRDAVDSSEGSVLSLGSGHNLYLKRDRKKAGPKQNTYMHMFTAVLFITAPNRNNSALL